MKKILILIGIIILISFIWLANSVYTSNNSQEHDDSHNAWHTLKIFIKPAIISVNRIRFPSATEGYDSTTNLGKGRYKIISYVEADNTLGERRKIPFAAIIIKKPKGWEIESLDIQKAIKIHKPKQIQNKTSYTSSHKEVRQSSSKSNCYYYDNLSNKTIQSANAMVSRGDTKEALKEARKAKEYTIRAIKECKPYGDVSNFEFTAKGLDSVIHRLSNY